MYIHKFLLAFVALASISFVNISLANEQVLGDSEGLGLNNEPSRSTSNPENRPPEKVSSLGDGVYIRQYNDFGQPMVEVHPESGPSYYYNENTIQQPNPQDGVHFRDMPEWMLSEW